MFTQVDDVTLGGTTEALLQDLATIESLEEIGLSLNNHKSEIICTNHVTRGTIISSLPGAQIIDPSDAHLLGSPIGNLDSISAVLGDKVKSLAVMGDRLRHFSAHDSLLLLRNSFSIPKLLYTLRTSPCFLSPTLDSYDKTLKSIVSTITNIHLVEGEPAWLQAALPVGSGGLGIRSAVQLAPSAFLASAAASSDLVSQILPASLQSLALPHVDDALATWSIGHDNNPPSGETACIQKTWDAFRISSTVDQIMNNAVDNLSRACTVIGCFSKGIWCMAPCSSHLIFGPEDG